MRSLTLIMHAFTKHALYVPVYVVFVGAVFWEAVPIAANANPDGMKHLASAGWLFTTQSSEQKLLTVDHSWDYLALSDLSKIEWYAMK